MLTRAAAGGRRPLGLAVLGAASISASAVLVKLAGVGAATTGSTAASSPCPCSSCWPCSSSGATGAAARSARIGAFVAGLFLAVDLVLWNHAIAEVGAGIATVLGNLQILFVAFAAWALFQERPERRFLVFLPVVMAGVVMVSGLAGGASGGIHPLAGVGYGLAPRSPMRYSCSSCAGHRRARGTPPGPLAEATAGRRASARCCSAWSSGGFSLHIRWPSFGWLLLLSLTSQTIGWLLITSSLPRLPAAISSLTLLLQPGASMLLAFLVLNERPSLIQIAGAVVVCLGVLAASWQARPQQEFPADPPGGQAAGRVQAPARPRRPRASAAEPRYWW